MQLEHAGLLDLFGRVLSVEEVRRYKPAPEPYRLAAERHGVATAHIRLVSAHDWDVWGATKAGCAAALVARPGATHVAGWVPDVVGEDLRAVADAIARVDEPPG
jgi:2-haloacid dehalogenase